MKKEESRKVICHLFPCGGHLVQDSALGGFPQHRDYTARLFFPNAISQMSLC